MESVRQYIARTPSHPLEPAGRYSQGGGVFRYVAYLEDGAKVTTWVFPD